ncbi:MAG TPA: hypothetical protein PLD82_10145, partial [Spirochaetota bacterium]|nr:hypothetical protein [Spirochaetota bacterium]
MKIRYGVVFGVFLFGVTALSASWMGETWLWVSVRSVAQSTNNSLTVSAELDIKYWGLGRGHGTTYGKEFPGKTFRVHLSCPSQDVARGLQAGQTGWVKHHASSWLYRDEDGKPRGGSSSRWEWLGDTAW